MSSWAMAQNCTNAEITSALVGLKALGFNAVTVSPFGVHMNESFGDRYKNKAGQRFFTDAPYASSFGPAWTSMDWIMSEATRLHMTVVFSLFMSWGDTGTAPDLANAGTTNAYNFGKAVATRYAGYPNIVWHVMGDFGWSYNQGPGLALDALFHGIKDTEGTSHRLIIAEPANGSTSLDQFISEEGGKGYQWFKQSANTVYDYGSNSVEQFDRVYNRTGRYPVVDIEPPYVNAPHYHYHGAGVGCVTDFRHAAFCLVQLARLDADARHRLRHGPTEPGAARTQLLDVHPRWRWDQLWPRKMVAVWRHRPV